MKSERVSETALRLEENFRIDNTKSIAPNRRVRVTFIELMLATAQTTVKFATDQQKVIILRTRILIKVDEKILIIEIKP